MCQLLKPPQRRCLSLAGQVRSVDRPHTAVSADARLLEQLPMTNPGTYLAARRNGILELVLGPDKEGK
jgi:hypothetical protein